MAEVMADNPMAKRNDVTVKMDAEAVRIAKIVAAFRGLSLAEYLSEMVLTHGRIDLEHEMSKQTKPAKMKKDGGPKA